MGKFFSIAYVRHFATFNSVFEILTLTIFIAELQLNPAQFKPISIKL